MQLTDQKLEVAIGRMLQEQKPTRPAAETPQTCPFCGLLCDDVVVRASESGAVAVSMMSAIVPCDFPLSSSMSPLNRLLSASGESTNLAARLGRLRSASSMADTSDNIRSSLPQPRAISCSLGGSTAGATYSSI